MGKKILLAFDGSGESPEINGPNEDADLGFSNPLKLHLLAGGSLDPEKTKENVPNQISLYIEGVAGQSDYWILRQLNNFLIGTLSVQINPIRKRLQDIYEEGDKIYITGFSRGAASARKFAVELSENGLSTASGGKVENVPVEFLGCFDTVSNQWLQSIWNPFERFGFYNRLIRLGIQSSDVLGEKDGKLPPNVKKAVHNLSMDDRRPGMFSPVFMDSTDDRVHEAWFPGDHGDTGGSWYVDGLSNGSARYMQQFMEEAGLVFLKPEQVSADDLQTADKTMTFDPKHVSLEPDATKKSHVSSMGSSRPRPIITVSENDHFEDGTVHIHKSFLERLQSDSPMQLKAGEDPTPYEINPNIKEVKKFVVVGDLCEKLDEKTDELKKALESY